MNARSLFFKICARCWAANSGGMSVSLKQQVKSWETEQKMSQDYLKVFQLLANTVDETTKEYDIIIIPFLIQKFHFFCLFFVCFVFLHLFVLLVSRLLLRLEKTHVCLYIMFDACENILIIHRRWSWLQRLNYNLFWSTSASSLNQAFDQIVTVHISLLLSLFCSFFCQHDSECTIKARCV
jgi:hypothetical protein